MRETRALLLLLGSLVATAARVWVAGPGAGDAQQEDALAGSGDAQCASEWDQGVAFTAHSDPAAGMVPFAGSEHGQGQGSSDGWWLTVGAVVV